MNGDSVFLFVVMGVLITIITFALIAWLFVL